jgi:hypothetical protein
MRVLASPSFVYSTHTPLAVPLQSSYIEFYHLIQKVSFASGIVEAAVRFDNEGVVTAATITENEEDLFFSGCCNTAGAATVGLLKTDTLQTVSLI